MKKTNIIAICSLMTALGTCVALLSSIFSLFIYVGPLICSYIILLVTKISSNKYATLTFLSTSILMYLVVANKECFLLYFLFFGYYPIIKEKLNHLNKLLSNLILVILFNASFLISEYMLIKVFGIEFGSENNFYIYVSFAVLMNIYYVLFIFLYKKLSILIELKIIPLIKKYMK